MTSTPPLMSRRSTRTTKSAKSCARVSVVQRAHSRTSQMCFVATATVLTLTPILWPLVAQGADGASEKTLYISPAGSDENPGTLDQPVRSPQKAYSLARTGMAIHFLSPRRDVYVSPA